MAFGLNVDFGGIMGNLTKQLKTLAASQIKNLSNMVKTSLISTINGAVGFDLTGMIGTSLNLSLSNVTGGLNFSNLLKNIPFPKLGSMNLNALWGAIDGNIGQNINAFAKNLSKVYKNLSFDDLNLTTKLTGAVNSQLTNISSEIEAGTIAGKSSLGSLSMLTNLSNKQIRDFSFNPGAQLDFVNGLTKRQKDKIFNLTFNSIPESTIFNDQVTGLSKTGIESFANTEETSFGFSFDSDKVIDDVKLNTTTITQQQTQIEAVEQEKNPMARKINLKRYGKENETLAYLNSLDPTKFRVADNITL
tara:strand:- start:7104 stop:8015 length:912 start_codon:yes stop_codon:yes gene_type:complete